jgi:hypothetical protein
MGRFRAAERRISRGVEPHRALYTTSPSVDRYRSWLFQGLALRAWALVGLGQLAPVEVTVAEARALLEHIDAEASRDDNDRERIIDLEQARARGRPRASIPRPCFPGDRAGPNRR